MDRLNSENATYAHTSGISPNNQHLGFVPAFRNDNTGEISLSKFADGRLAPIHILEGLPEGWDFDSGSLGRLYSNVTSGFMLHGVFFTREEAANFPS